MTDLYILQAWEYPRNEHHPELPASTPQAFSNDVEALDHLFFCLVQYNIAEKGMVEDALDFLATNTSIVLSDWSDTVALNKEDIEALCDWYYERINDDLVCAGYSLTLSSDTTFYFKLFGESFHAVKVNGNISDAFWVAQYGDFKPNDFVFTVSYWINHKKFEHEFTSDEIHQAEYIGDGQWRMPEGEVISLMRLEVI